jgi:NAD(P)-dependent dehydrogenase (short-subunit alcohol dehydrogenase family)
LPDEKPETWQPQLEINLTGTWNSVRLGLRALIDQGTGGRIVTLSSIAGLVGIRSLASGYSVSKAGIIQLTRQAAVEGAPYGVTANAVCPGYVRTAINPGAWRDEKVEREIAGSHPLGRLGEAADVAGAVAFLASDDASWVTGVELPVDGGWTCV